MDQVFDFTCMTRDGTSPVAILQVSALSSTGRTSDFSGSLMRGERLRSHQSHAAQPAVVPPKNNLSHNRLLSKGLPTKSLVHKPAFDLSGAQGALWRIRLKD